MLVLPLQPVLSSPGLPHHLSIKTAALSPTGAALGHPATSDTEDKTGVMGI